METWKQFFNLFLGNALLKIKRKPHYDIFSPLVWLGWLTCFFYVHEKNNKRKRRFVKQNRRKAIEHTRIRDVRVKSEKEGKTMTSYMT